MQLVDVDFNVIFRHFNEKNALSVKNNYLCRQIDTNETTDPAYR